MFRPKIDWTNPDYSEVLRYRTEALARLRNNKGAIAQAKVFYSTHWSEFINDWMMTFDPRKLNTGQPHTVPFILFPRQEEFVQWVFERWRAQERGLAEKSRDVGFSWLAAACAVCIWLFYPYAVIGFGSRKKESVDNGDSDPDSLFWKIRKIIEYLPSEFIPFAYGEGNKWALVVNPENNAVIKGEIGDGIGMGGRTSIHFVDEADALEHQQLAEASLAGTTDCRIDISTANNVGSVFYNNRRSLPENQVFIFDWTEDPRKRLNPDIPPQEEPWYVKKKGEINATAFASQVDRNPNAAIANTYIPTELITNAENRRVSSIEILPQIPWSLGLDASGFGNDENVLWRRRGRLSLPPLIPPNMDGVMLARWVEKQVDDLLELGPVGLIGIERDGPGGSCADQLKYGPYASITRAVHTGAKLRNGQDYNLRAYLHRQAREYLEHEDPYLPRDPTFKAQGTALLHEYKGGTLLIESKEEYRARLSGSSTKTGKKAGKSPDRWDAFVLSFIPPISEPIKEKAFNAAIRSARNWTPLDKQLGY